MKIRDNLNQDQMIPKDFKLKDEEFQLEKDKNSKQLV